MIGWSCGLVGRGREEESLKSEGCSCASLLLL